jgi:thiol-disulfide isomerase/thioredoxin
MVVAANPNKDEKPRPAAPDLVGGVAWLNADKPISMEDLKGRIVILDFWTLCCINCIHTLPDLAQIEARYPGKTTPADHRAARAMSAYFVNFARTGTPNGVGLPDWPVYRDDVRPMMDFTANGPTPGADPWRERLDLAERVAESARDKSRK